MVLLKIFNPLNAELNPICYLLALLGAHHFLHVSRIRVNGTLSACDRFILKIFFYGVKRMYMLESF